MSEPRIRCTKGVRGQKLIGEVRFIGNEMEQGI